MTQYRTLNPLGSMAPKDLFDNAQNVDNWSNGAEPFYEDRFGVMRRSFSGMNFEFEAAQIARNAAFDAQMAALGYVSKGTYAAGVVLETYSEYVAVPGVVSGGTPAFYRPGPNAALPLTLEGDWAIDGPLLRLLDADDVLRQELSNGSGSLVDAAVIGNVDDLQLTAFADGISRSLGERFSQVVNVAEFADLSVAGGLNTAFTAAQIALTRPGTIIVPSGFFTANATIFLRTDIPVRVVGQGMYSTVIDCSAEMTGLPIFKSDAAVVDNHHLSDMTILGNGYAAFGYQCEHLIHGSIVSVMVQGTTTAAIRTNDGYNNYFDKLQILSNFGDGLDITGVNNNNVNLNDCNIYANDGIGVKLSNGWGITLNGCSIEGNKIAGLMAWDLRGLKINGGYFERNAQIGYTYTTADGSPENLTIKADIHLLSGARTIQLLGDGVKGCVIDGVSFTPYGALNVPTAGLSQDCIIFATDVDNIKITNNDIVGGNKNVPAMIGLYNNNAKARCTSMRIEQNTLNNVRFLGVGLPAYSFKDAHNVENGFEPLKFNYASQVRTSYINISGTSGTLTDSVQRYGNIVAWDASVGDRLYGYTIDLTQHPELRGRHVWFGVAYRVQEAGTGLQVSLNGATDNNQDALEPVNTAGEWRFKSVMLYVTPSETSLTVAFRRIGGGTQPLVVAAPSLAVFGSGLSTMNGRR